MNEINRQLSRVEAIQIFEQNAVLHVTKDAIDIHRIGELFGENTLRKLESLLTEQGSFSPGLDWNASGGSGDDPLLPYVYISGFLKIVSERNHELQVTAHKVSEYGKLYDQLKEQRFARIEASEAEEQRKREERKGKRSTSRKTNQETGTKTKGGL